MGTLYENIKSLCDQNGITGGKMCVDLGLSKSLMTGLKTGRKKSIQVETAKKIADYFNVPVEVLTEEKMSLDERIEKAKKGKSTSYDELPESNRELIDMVKTLSQEEAALLLAALKANRTR